LLGESLDDALQVLELLASRDLTFRSRLFTGDAQRLDFPQTLHRHNAGTPRLLQEEIPYDRIQVTTRVCHLREVCQPEARVRLLDEIIDVGTAQRVDVTTQPAPNLGLVGEDMGRDPVVSGSVVQKIPYSLI
jgi:hypothetical protein